MSKAKVLGPADMQDTKRGLFQLCEMQSKGYGKVWACCVLGQRI